MASLKDKLFGKISFHKFVTTNKRFNEVEFQLETPTFLMKKVGSNKFEQSPRVREFKKKTKLHIIDQKLFNDTFVEVKIGGAKGFIDIGCIERPKINNGTQYEDEVIKLINNVIIETGRPIDIKIKGDHKIHKDISYALKVETSIKQKAGVKGDPKCDIILCKDKKKPLDISSIFISHKKEGGPEAFQQYGGISAAAGLSINRNPIVQKFLSIVAQEIDTHGKLENSIIAYFNDKTLMNQAIFGPEYGRQFSIEHTQLIGQGRPKLTSRNGSDYFELDFSSHMLLSGDLTKFVNGYLPVLGATFRAGRSFEYNNKRYYGARVGIYPQQLVANRVGAVKYNL